MLPKDFTLRMQRLMGDEYGSFVKSFDDKRAYGLRINPLKLKAGHASLLPFRLERVPWAREGFYADLDEHPGKHPLHEAGAYYIQEPSAMAAVVLLDPRSGEKICDLCAAPGGKSTQIAGRLGGKGFLASNDFSAPRARTLLRNIERMGVVNAAVCSEHPGRMAERFGGFFDKVLVDAPCSGEGMFRKERAAAEEWSLEQVRACAQRQKKILESADAMLKDGGVLVYSTCTFSPDENEDILIWFLRTHKGYVVESRKDFGLDDAMGIEGGRKDFVSDSLLPLSPEECEAIDGSMRLWPHRLRGDGHFAVRLKKGRASKKESFKNRKKIFSEDFRREAEELEKLLAELFKPGAASLAGRKGRVKCFGDRIYITPPDFAGVNGINYLGVGLHAATRKKNRLEPAHALAMASGPSDVRQYFECGYDAAIRYIHGEPIPCGMGLRGHVLVGYAGCSLGWGKAGNGIIKNHYPKGLRI